MVVFIGFSRKWRQQHLTGLPARGADHFGGDVVAEHEHRRWQRREAAVLSQGQGRQRVCQSLSVKNKPPYSLFLQNTKHPWENTVYLAVLVLSKSCDEVKNWTPCFLLKQNIPLEDMLLFQCLHLARQTHRS